MRDPGFLCMAFRVILCPEALSASFFTLPLLAADLVRDLLWTSLVRFLANLPHKLKLSLCHVDWSRVVCILGALEAHCFKQRFFEFCISSLSSLRLCYNIILKSVPNAISCLMDQQTEVTNSSLIANKKWKTKAGQIRVCHLLSSIGFGRLYLSVWSSGQGPADTLNISCPRNAAGGLLAHDSKTLNIELAGLLREDYSVPQDNDHHVVHQNGESRELRLWSTCLSGQSKLGRGPA